MFRDYIMNHSFLRNVGLIYGEIDNYPNTPGSFTPYFEYEIGRNQDNFKLYFPRLPKPKLYYNFIFLKLWAYNPHDAVKYLEYHYSSYGDKRDFLLFLNRHLNHHAAALKKGSNRLTITTICMDWVAEELNNLTVKRKITAYNQFIRNYLTVIVKNELQHLGSVDTTGAASVEKLANQISSGLQAKLDSMLENTEIKISALTDKYETGNIQLTNANMKDKLIGLFLCLKDLTAKSVRKNKPGDSLFAKMDLNDIAQILRLHFSPYKGLKIDSIERRIYEVNNNLRSDNPAYKELTKAVQKIFLHCVNSNLQELMTKQIFSAYSVLKLRTGLESAAFNA